MGWSTSCSIYIIFFVHIIHIYEEHLPSSRRHTALRVCCTFTWLGIQTLICLVLIQHKTEIQMKTIHLVPRFSDSYVIHCSAETIRSSSLSM
ncbi:hypothetical protein P280DRAFT_322526 [Massarina eburnea CBS 473.64]|uniref:Uncharacterized protein n=1 Tax=Massarina eburnea CBS 473.64 TaxID=1395130 RepID=A0A6A6S088_9PLEO|nr:hypothetical protein P280DRAFT_322526 [Massarina eburnea CBS 473.64]